MDGKINCLSFSTIQVPINQKAAILDIVSDPGLKLSTCLFVN